MVGGTKVARPLSDSWVTDQGSSSSEPGPRAIAGIMNEQGNVFGMMPHPERNAEPLLGSGQGVKLFMSLVGKGAQVAA